MSRKYETSSLEEKKSDRKKVILSSDSEYDESSEEEDSDKNLVEMKVISPPTDEDSSEEIYFEDPKNVMFIPSDDEDVEDIIINIASNSSMPLPDVLISKIASYITVEENLDLLSLGFYTESNISLMNLDLSNKPVNFATLDRVVDKLLLFKSLSINLNYHGDEINTMTKITHKITSLVVSGLKTISLPWLKLCPLTKLEIAFYGKSNENPFDTFPKLEELIINTFDVEEIEIKQNNKVKKLAINDYCGGNLDFISELSNLEDLLLSTGNMGRIRASNDEDITNLHLEKCKKLKSVSIYGFNALMNLDFINSLPLLESFNYFGEANLYDDEVEPIIIKNKSLRKVDIKGFESREYNFSGCENLEDLILYCCATTLLLKGTSLKYLALDHLAIDNLDFLSDCPELLKFSYNNHAKDGEFDITTISHCEKLKTLSIRLCHGSFLRGKESVSKLNNLEHFSCENVETDLFFLSSCLNLDTLDLTNVSIGNGTLDLSFLENLTKLTRLFIRNCQPINIHYVSNCIDLENLSIRPGKTLYFLSNLNKLNFLILDDSGQLISLKGLSNCTKLDKLFINSSFSLKTISGLEKCTNLQELMVDHSKIKDICKLELLPKLRKVILVNTDVEDISPLLRCNNLTAVSLSNNNRIRNGKLLDSGRFILLSDSV